jgi:type IV secretory pathway VirD2 relaxase
MSLIEAEHALDAALNGGKVRRKVNNTGNLRSKAKRVAKRGPEVMVKITGFGKGAAHIKAHLNYVTRNAKLELETDRGDSLRDKEAVRDLFGQWTEDIANSPRHKNQRDTMHMVLSMPEGTPEVAVRNAARAYAKRLFSANHEYIFVLHTDEPHPHVHLTVKMLGFDGKRLNPRKADLQAWREAFAREMRDQGIDAEATPRASRGVVRKAENSIVRHIERGDERRPPRVPRVKTARMKEVVAELSAEANGRSPAEKPWETRIRQRQQLVRNAWLAAAVALEMTATPYQEHFNERPEYDKLDTARVRAAQRAAAVYQSNLERLGFRAPAVALARVRDLSRLDVVQHQRPAQVLLHAHAPDGVGRYGGADHDLRRPRTRALTFAARASGDGERGRGMTGDTSTVRTLAATIQRFVRAMPPIDTERHKLKRLLASQFIRNRDREPATLASEVPTFTAGAFKPSER